MKNILSACGVCFMLAACAPSGVYDTNGYEVYPLTCETQDQCVAKASKICQSGGYKIVDRSTVKMGIAPGTTAEQMAPGTNQLYAVCLAPN